MYTWLIINSKADISNIKNYISNEYAPEKIANILQQGISGAVKSILIEHNYNDKDYRSTYYNFYSKKGRKYNQDCVRLHFFDETISYDDKSYRLIFGDENITDHYFGYMVLRPTGIATIGRSIVSPNVRGVSGFVIRAFHKVHVLGYRLRVFGFPSMDQHIDISVCAHVACWSILRHYSEKYSLYKEYLVHDVTMMAQQYNPGGIVPSLGLDVTNAERVFQEANTFPLYIVRDEDITKKLSFYQQDPSFYRQLIAYLESGFPLFAALHNIEHAVTIVGYDRKNLTNIKTTGLQYSWDTLKSLIVIDDNYLPYISIPTNGPANTTCYSSEDIDSFIVALPEKIYYPADAVEILSHTLRKFDPIISLPNADESYIRYFITTGSSLRRFMRQRASEFDQDLLKVVMELPFAQFLWVIEYSSKDDWNKGQISARALIDATASTKEVMPLWLIHNRHRALVYERGDVNFDVKNTKVMDLNGMERTALTRMEINLDRI